MRYLLVLILVLVIVVMIMPVLLQDPGYVLISYADISIETTITFMLLIIVIGLVSMILIYRLLKWMLGLPDMMYLRGQQRSIRRAQENFYKGLTELAQGHWQHAEKLLVSSSEANQEHLLAYLGAARAAQHQGEHERRDHYLKLAHRSSASAELATGITQAELQILQGQFERALATVNHLHQLEGDNTYILKMMLQLYLQLGEWNRVKERLPDFQKYNVIDDERATQLHTDVAVQQLRVTAAQGDAEKILSEYRGLPTELQQSETMIRECARLLLDVNDPDSAEQLLRTAIKHSWSKDLVLQYGQVNSHNFTDQLVFVKSWPEELTQDALVQLAIARLCNHASEFDKARKHLQTSIELGETPEAYHELGALMNKLHEHKQALTCFDKGLTLALQRINNP